MDGYEVVRRGAHTVVGVTCAMQPCRLEDERYSVRWAAVEALGKLEGGELAKHAEAIVARCDAAFAGVGGADEALSVKWECDMCMPSFEYVM